MFNVPIKQQMCWSSLNPGPVKVVTGLFSFGSWLPGPLVRINLSCFLSFLSRCAARPERRLLLGLSAVAEGWQIRLCKDIIIILNVKNINVLIEHFIRTMIYWYVIIHITKWKYSIYSGIILYKLCIFFQWWWFFIFQSINHTLNTLNTISDHRPQHTKFYHCSTLWKMKPTHVDLCESFIVGMRTALVSRYYFV